MTLSARATACTRAERGMPALRSGTLGSVACVRLLRRQEGVGQIASALKPHRVDDPHPDVGQRTNGHAVALAFAPLALVVRLRPGLLEDGLPGELIQHVAEGLDTGVAAMRLGVVATLVGHRRGAR